MTAARCEDDRVLPSSYCEKPERGGKRLIATKPKKRLAVSQKTTHVPNRVYQNVYMDD